MKPVTASLLATVLAILLSACPAKTETPAGTAKTEIPPEAALAEMDSALADAFIKKDRAFFEKNVSDEFVNQTASGPIGKAAMIRQIMSFPCEIKSIDTKEGEVHELADGFVIRTAKELRDGNCFGAKIADAYMATLYIKEAEGWKLAYHQSLDIRPEGDRHDKKTTKPARPPKPEKGTEEQAPSPQAGIRNDAELASELIAHEKDMLAAWSKNDKAKFEKIVAPDYVEVYPKGIADKNWLLDDVSGHDCDVTHTVSGEAATKLGAGLVLLTYKAVEKGTCAGKPLFFQSPLNTTTIWRTDGEKWQMVFHMVTPERS